MVISMYMQIYDFKHNIQLNTHLFINNECLCFCSCAFILKTWTIHILGKFSINNNNNENNNNNNKFNLYSAFQDTQRCFTVYKKWTSKQTNKSYAKVCTRSLHYYMRLDLVAFLLLSKKQFKFKKRQYSWKKWYNENKVGETRFSVSPINNKADSQ